MSEVISDVEIIGMHLEEMTKKLCKIESRLDKLEQRQNQLYMQVNPICTPKPIYTRGQEVRVNGYKGIYIDKVTGNKPGKHKVYVDYLDDIAYLDDKDIRPLQKESK